MPELVAALANATPTSLTAAILRSASREVNQSGRSVQLPATATIMGVCNQSAIGDPGSVRARRHPMSTRKPGATGQTRRMTPSIEIRL
jgi:hypothetical protein